MYEDESIVDAHFCPMSKGRLKPYLSFLCSQCMGKGINLAMPLEEVQNYNKKNEKKTMPVKDTG